MRVYISDFCRASRREHGYFLSPLLFSPSVTVQSRRIKQPLSDRDTFAARRGLAKDDRNIRLATYFSTNELMNGPSELIDRLIEVGMNL